MKSIASILILAMVTSCAAPSEGYLHRKTSGSPYNKYGTFRERVNIPTLGR